jgi:putative membrane protein
MSFSMRASGIVLGAIIFASATGCASTQTTGMGRASGSEIGSAASVTTGDSAFARNACESSWMQAQLGGIAAANTKTKEIRAFAKQLAHDHARAEKELSAIFSRRQLPPDPELDLNIEQSLNHLARLKGGAFDQAFKNEVISEHEAGIAVFQREATEGTDPDLRAFAQKHLPELERHLQIARNLPVSSDAEGPAPEAGVANALGSPLVRGVTTMR